MKNEINLIARQVASTQICALSLQLLGSNLYMYMYLVAHWYCRTSDSRAKDLGFDPHSGRSVVSLSL